MGGYDRITLATGLAISAAIPLVAFVTGYVAATFVIGAFVVVVVMLVLAEFRSRPERGFDEARQASPRDGGSPSPSQGVRSGQT